MATPQSGSAEVLFHKNRRRPNFKNRIDDSIALEQHEHGQVSVSNELRKKGIFVSPSVVHSIWLRHDLAYFNQRPTAQEKHAARTSNVLTDAQVVALEQKAKDDLVQGEI